MWRASAVARLSDAVLTLHPSILKVFILEETVGRFTVVEEAARRDVAANFGVIDQSLLRGSLNPAYVLGNSDLNLGAPRLIGAVYGNEAVMFAGLGGKRVLAISTEPTRFEEALQQVSQALPALLENPRRQGTASAAPKSAAEAAEIARSYVAAVIRTSDVSVDDVNLHQPDRLWVIQGTFRSNPFARSHRFQLQLNSEDGAVVTFVSLERTSLTPLIIGVMVVLGTLFFLVWVLSLLR